ncbi:MAG: extracellular solute-binding protein [Lachnospiraceae bacterium]|nr:extracellular solute-binding protein [Lachnospiraceae bacterium]
MKKAKRGLAILLLFAVMLTSLTGCGNDITSPDNNTGQNTTDKNGNTNDAESSSGSIAMGRYVEKTIDVSGISGYGSSLYTLEDGSLIISDVENSFLMTEDSGESWKTVETEWKWELQEENEIRSFAVGKDNTVGVIYNTMLQDPSAEDYNPFVENLEVIIVKPDGTQIPVQMNLSGEDEYLYRILISDSGRIFVSTYGTISNIYEIKEDGSSEIFLELESMAILVQFQNQLMIIDDSDDDGLLIYDMEKEQYIEDDVLNDFIKENYPNRSNNGGSFYNFYFFMGEENILYLAGEKGLHRHVIGGSAIEQVIDGGLSIFNNPAYALRSMLMLNSSEFMALFTNGKLVRFTYKPDIPTVPSEKLKVYSLENNSTVRQAITLYQMEYPDVFVEYEVGMEGGDSVTRDDALKKLNTKIAAGECPDVFILDNMPVDSYIEKGLLADISPVLENLNGEDALFENVIEAFRREDKIYEIPCEIQIPIIFGEKAYISGITDLKEMADAMENLREKYPGKDICGFCTADSIMRLFSMTSVPYWKTDKGTMDREALTDYLTQVKRIYDAQMDTLGEEVIDRYYDLSAMYREIYGYSLDDNSDWIRMGPNYIDYVMGLRRLIVATLAGDYDYAMLVSMQQMAEYEDCELRLMNSDIFYPQTLAGISAVSENGERAEDFLRQLLGKENQSLPFQGFAVNQSAFNSIWTISEEAEEDEGYGDIAMQDEDGRLVHLISHSPKEEEVRILRNWIESANIPYIEDDLLEEAVYEAGAEYLKGSRSLEDTLDAIEKKVALYMAE